MKFYQFANHKKETYLIKYVNGTSGDKNNQCI